MRHLTGILLAAGLTAALVQGASAADLAARPVYKAPPVPAPVFTWTGFYGGLHVGYGWSDSTATVTTTTAFPLDPATLGQNGNGVVGGGQIGYNYQFAPNWVVGIEADISGTGIRNTTFAPITIGGAPIALGYNQLAERDINWLATVRGRLGYAADRWLIYVTGGGAWGDIDYTAGPNYPGVYSPVTASKTHSGWTVGGGLEYAVTNNWTARAEYLYYDLGSATLTNVGIAPVIVATQTWDRNTINVVRVGVNYKF